MLEGSILALDVGGGTQDCVYLGARPDRGKCGQDGAAGSHPNPGPPPDALKRRPAAHLPKGPADGRRRPRRGGAPPSGQGLPLYATAQAALTFSDRLEAVAGWGVVLTESPPPEAVSLTLGDVDLEALGRVLTDFEVPLPRRFAVAVQDHGFPPGKAIAVSASSIGKIS